MTVTNIPPGTKSLALIVHDPDAPVKNGFTHWVVWNLDANGTIPENLKGADEGLNSSNKQEYKGMCPHRERIIIISKCMRLISS